MTEHTVTPFYLIGLSVRTSNEPGHAEKDIPQLWSAFLSGNAAAVIPGILDQDIYCVYTEYESDYTRPYTALLGYKVASLDVIPEGFRGITVSGGTYKQVTATGKLAEGIVFDAWTHIWNSDWKRAYSADFEVYGTKAQHPEAAEVAIFIAVNE